jgi:glutamine synthetase type III
MSCRGTNDKKTDERFVARAHTNSDISEEINRLTETLASAVRLLELCNDEHTFALSYNKLRTMYIVAVRLWSLRLRECGDEIHALDNEN